MCVCACLLNVGVFTREDRHTDDMKNKQAGIAHEELKTDRKAWIFGGGEYRIYIYIYMYFVKFRELGGCGGNRFFRHVHVLHGCLAAENARASAEGAQNNIKIYSFITWPWKSRVM